MERKLAVSMFGQKRLSREGGIEIVVKELCTRMVRNGCTVTCYNRSGHHVSGAKYDNKTEYEGICQKYVPTIEKKGLAAVSSSFFAAFYSAFGKYDVVHIHAEGPAFFAWLPKLFGKNVVVTIHGIDWQREKWKSGFGSKFIRQGEKNAVKYADEIIVLSKGVQDYFKNTYDRDTWFIPNGVNRPEIRKAELITEKFGLTENSYILFLGRLVPEKGIRYLVEAFKNVCTDKKLVIAGGSSDTDSFMKELQESAKGDDRIIFTGFVQGKILDELYSNAYIYTLPSDLEGMPLSLLEAMSYGNCCLVSDIPECTEVVEDKALIFKKSDAGLHVIDPKILAMVSIEADKIGTVDEMTGKTVKVDLDRQLLKPLAGTGKMFCYDSPEYVKDMGTPDRFHQVEDDFKVGRVSAKNLSNKQKAVFLDRDGTINKYVGFLRNINDFELIDGVAEAIKKINASGYLAIVVTNQPVIARGEVAFQELEEIHNKMETELGLQGAYLDAIYYCPHHPHKGYEGEIPELKIECDCRKPKPGMLLKAAGDYNIDLSQSYMIGDGENDIKAGLAAGCKTVLINSEGTGAKNEDFGQNDTLNSVKEFVEKYL